jgi:hypothetical protein
MQPREHAALRQEAGTAASRLRPRVHEARAVCAPLDVDAPLLRVLRRIAQALERDAHLHHVAVRRHAAGGLEEEVRTGVGAAAERAARRRRALGAHAVQLHAQRVHAEKERAAPVTERVQEDDDVVVAADVVSVRARGADELRLRVVRDDAEVDGVRRVPDADLRPLHGGPPVRRLVLREPADDRGPGPHVFLQHAVHDYALIEPRDLNRRARRHLLQG